MIVLPLAVSLASLLFVAFLYHYIAKGKVEHERAGEIASFIQEGANAFLKRLFLSITYFIIPLFGAILLVKGIFSALSFLYGVSLSLIAAYIGMNAATKANVRTTDAARRSPGKALKIAFWGGGVMGVSVVGFSIFGISTLYTVYQLVLGTTRTVLDSIVPFGFGASLAALFAQLGGGIYTKAADIGADLVGKIEAKIPEDDPRNPAVIADQVGDNVGDCAGRGADLFESFSDNIIGTMILGLAFIQMYGASAVLFPLLAETAGVLSTMVAILLIRERSREPIATINISLFAAGVINAAAFYLLSRYLLGDLRIFICALLGLVASLVVGLAVQYYTGTKYKPVREIANSSISGPALTVLRGISTGMESSFTLLIIISAVVITSYYISGLFGIAAATVGILSTTGIIMASDTFGPISDNAAGIAEMSGLSSDVRGSLDVLDAVGNTTKAITKGYAMSCAILSAFVLFAAYLQVTNLSFVDIANPVVLIGLIVGGALTFMFSSLTIEAVGETANQMVDEVRRQFREIKGLMEGKANPNYARCVDISTKNALKKMVPPTLLTLITTFAIGFLLGLEGLGAFIIGATITGALMAVFMINSGGAMDNAKKFIEAGNLGGKGTSAHSASVVGDTVGDPLKDTAGPSLHIYVKLIAIIALTFAPIFS